MSCAHCANAAQKTWHGFDSTCSGCKARIVARSQPFIEARASGVVSTAYRSLLTVAGVSHDDAKRAAEADFMGGQRA